MQSSANVELSPEEDTTMSVSANDFSDLSEGALRVVGMPCVTVGDRNEGIPTPPLEEVNPSLF